MGALKASLAKLESPAIPTNGSRKPRKRIREEIGREIQRDEELR
jgi:hypothetical protein